MYAKIIMAAQGAALCLLAAPAAAQDETKNFNGPHVRAIVGWDNFSAGNGPSTSKDDVVFGGGLGYDFQSGNLVVGIESELTTSGGSAGWDDVAVAGDHLRVEVSRDIYVGGRLGYAVAPQLLVYGKVGYSNLKVKNSYDANMLGSSQIKDHVTSDGFRVGAGAEYSFSGNFYARAEYRYSHYGDVNDFDLQDFDVDVDRSQILLGAGYRF